MRSAPTYAGTAARGAVGAALLVAALAAAGCGSSPGKASGDKSASTGSSSGSSASSSAPASPTTAAPATPTAPPPPACGKVWVAGKRLPPNYAGCVQGGKRMAASGTHCESGQTLFVYAGHFFAVPEGKVYHAANLHADPAYKRIRRSCGG